MNGHKKISSLIAISVFAFCLAVSSTGFAKPRSLDGAWRGGGYFKTANGGREKISCRVNYRRINAKIFSFTGTCVNPSGSIRQVGEVIKATSKSYVGDFYNSQYNISGRIRIVVNGSRQSVTLTSSQGSGFLSLSKR